MENKNKKILIGLAIAIGVCALACLALALALGFFGKSVADSVEMDPAEAAKTGHEIADYDLPSGYSEQMAMGLLGYKFVAIIPDDTSSDFGVMIMLAEFKSQTSDKQMADQMRQSFEQQTGQSGFDIEVVEVREMTIRGEETQVVISEGTTDEEPDMVFRQLITVFPGKSGQAILMIQGPVSAWDEELVDDFIASIR